MLGIVLRREDQGLEEVIPGPEGLRGANLGLYFDPNAASGDREA